jgi:hypothetical protein
LSYAPYHTTCCWFDQTVRAAALSRRRVQRLSEQIDDATVGYAHASGDDR